MGKKKPNKSAAMTVIAVMSLVVGLLVLLLFLLGLQKTAVAIFIIHIGLMYLLFKLLTTNAVDPETSLVASKRDYITFSINGENLSVMNYLDYKSPSGGYMSYAQFKVKGTNTKTGRINTKTIRAHNENDAISMMEKDGFEAPFVDSVIPFEKPTEAQLNFMKNLGLEFPKDIVKEDATAILSRINEASDYEEIANPGLMQYAFAKNVPFSLFESKDFFMFKLAGNLEVQDLLEYYVYRIYCKEIDIRPGNPLVNNRYEEIKEVAKRVSKDDSIMRSFKDRNDYDDPNRGTKIYKFVCKEFGL